MFWRDEKILSFPKNIFYNMFFFLTPKYRGTIGIFQPYSKYVPTVFDHAGETCWQGPRYISAVLEVPVRGQTVHLIGAKFCACIILDSRDKSLDMFQHVNGFHVQNFSGFSVQISET